MSRPDLAWVDPLSLTSCFSKAKHQGNTIASFTCFIFRHGTEDYLVSAWHNFSGRRADNHDLLSISQGVDRQIPNEIEVSIPFRTKLAGNEFGTFTLEFEINLYPSDLSGAPIWLVHPKFGHSVDVAAIPFRAALERTCRVQYLPGKWGDPTDGFVAMIGNEIYKRVHDEIPYDIRFLPVNVHATSNLPSAIGDDVFILGFPKGLLPTKQLPIWKKGSIATEPEVDAHDLPLLLVDSMPREGLSGSPAVQLRPGGSANIRGGQLRLMAGEARKFLGLYSGRDHDREAEAQLGRIWKARAVGEVCSGNRKGVSSVQLDELLKEVHVS